EEKLHCDAQRLTYQHLQSYAEYVAGRGRGASIWVFVDRTLQLICRSSKGQRNWYSGCKKHHAIKFQAVTVHHQIGLFHIC
ncbi:hypothetical protein L211DRAFT_778360, partial [Terfezia boudieri ATCC MYA-4762]